MKITQIQIDARHDTDVIEIRAKIGRLWYTHTIQVGHGASDCSVDRYYMGEVSIGMDLSKQSMRDEYLTVPIRILCVPREGKYWSCPTVWGIWDQTTTKRATDSDRTTIIEGLVAFNTNGVKK